METHKCKLCSRTFINGRALGGHMKAHLASLPLPSSKRHRPLPFFSSSGEEREEEEEIEEEEEEKVTVYELRENPRKSFKFSDPVFTFRHHHHQQQQQHVVSDIIVQDRESETDSRNRSTKQNSKHVSNSLSAQEENVAICLMMLSRDKWVQRENHQKSQKDKTRIKVKKLIRRKKKCEKCMKQFRSYRALFSHERICKLFLQEEEEEEGESLIKNSGTRRIFKCPFCFKLFGSGQALGGHKRSHLQTSTNATSIANGASLKHQINLIDLNLPAPFEEDDYSVVSDA